MNRIYISRDNHFPESREIYKWFETTFGPPQKWGGKTIEPTVLKSKYSWAFGVHNDGMYLLPCVWCTDAAYSMYLIRWK